LAPKVAPHQAALSLLMVDRFDDPAKRVPNQLFESVSAFQSIGFLAYWLAHWPPGFESKDFMPMIFSWTSIDSNKAHGRY
jgi:hypothetical protein